MSKYFLRVVHWITQAFFMLSCLTAYGIQSSSEDRITTDSIDRLNEKVKLYWASHPDSLIYFSEQAVALSEKIGYKNGQIQGLKNLGVAFYEKGKYTQSITFYKQAISLFDDSSEPATQSLIHGNVALPLIVINFPGEALEHLNIARAIAEQNELAIPKAYAVHNTGMLYNYQNNDNEAIKYYRESLKMYEEAGDTTKSTFILGNIAHILLKLNKTQQAEEHYKRSLELAEHYDNQKTLINALSSMGNLKTTQKDYQAALSYLFRAKEISESTGEKTEYLRLLINLSDCYKGLKDWKNAIHYAHAALDLAQEQRQLHYHSTSAFMLGELYQLANAPVSAATYFKQSKLLTDSLSTVNRQDETVRLEEKFKYEAQQAELTNQHDRELRNRRLTIILASVVVLGLLTTILLMSKMIKQKKRNLELERESKRLTESRNQELFKKDHFKNRLLSTLGHDIKPPIENLKLMMHVLKDDLIEKKDRARMVTMYNDQLESTLHFLDNLLLWAINQSEAPTIEKEWIELDLVFSEIQDIYQLQLMQKRMTLDIQPDNYIEVFFEPEMLKVVLRNLIHNAIKFSMPNSTISMSAEFDPQNSLATIRVQDQGRGIPKAIQEDLLTSARSSLGTNGERGTGLGLRICIQYLQANDSSLNLYSEEGQGTTFWFILPARTPFQS